MADLAVAAAVIGSGAAVAGALNTAVTLRRAGNNFREQIRPIVVVELRKHPYSKGVQEIVVTNYGHTPARDVTLTFTPPLKDPEPDAPEPTSATGALVRRLARTISVLAPNVPLQQVYYDTPAVPGGDTFVEGIPEHTITTVRYFGVDGQQYVDDFELDVHLVGLTTTIGSKDSAAAQRRTMADSLASMAETLRKRLPPSS